MKTFQTIQDAVNFIKDHANTGNEMVVNDCLCFGMGVYANTSECIAAGIRISPECIKPLREFLKANIGKTKSERKDRLAAIQITPEADTMQIRIIDPTDSGGIKEIAVAYFGLTEKVTHYGQQCYNEQLFYYSVLEDFTGEIRFSREYGPTAFMGEQRVSILMPLAPYDGIKTYLTPEKPESK